MWLGLLASSESRARVQVRVTAEGGGQEHGGAGVIVRRSHSQGSHESSQGWKGRVRSHRSFQGLKPESETRTEARSKAQELMVSKAS